MRLLGKNPGIGCKIELCVQKVLLNLGTAALGSVVIIINATVGELKRRLQDPKPPNPKALNP